LPLNAPIISLGEGKTPLVWSKLGGRSIGFKLESINPTGSFKDRGTAVLVSWLAASGVKEAVEDSSGNAGASFAAYAARSGIRGKIYIPSYASGPKRHQIYAYGQQVVPIPGPRSNAASAVLQDVNRGAIYASHAYLPHGTAGIATIAFELMEELNGPIGTIVLPVGHGSLLLGLYLGFQAIKKIGLINDLPRLIGVQAAACAPLYQAYINGSSKPVQIKEAKTVAEGVSITAPYHGEEVLRVIRESAGLIMSVEEELIYKGQKNLAALGLHVEITSALVWHALEQLDCDCPDPIIAILTGHGLKSFDTVA
jgi:threonine synthase